MPTAMKNSPSSRPLKGSMSASSSWRNSESATSTPARKAPRDGDSPISSMPSAAPTTSSSAAAVNTSRPPQRATACSAGRTTARLAATTSRIAARPFAAGASCMPEAPPASSGSSAIIGITAMSWNSSTANASRPWRAASWPRSASAVSTSAVDDSARPSPATVAARQSRPSASATPPSASEVSASCAPPRPNTARRITHSRRGSSSRPMMNNSSTTPNSANCSVAAGSPISARPEGPISIPATR